MRIRSRRLRWEFISSLTAAFLLLAVALVNGAEFKSEGQLEAPQDVPLAVMSTDPVVQRILDEDFAAHNRKAMAGGKSAMTLTVTVNHRVLQPGVSLADLSPGHPEVEPR